MVGGMTLCKEVESGNPFDLALHIPPLLTHTHRHYAVTKKSE